MKLALGSHNIRSIAYTLALLEKHGLPESAVEVQKLHGMADQLQAALKHRGLRIREYVPVGQMIPGMAYFVRRLLENTSNQSWLRAGFSDEVPTTCCWRRRIGQRRLISVPVTTGSAAAQRHKLSPAVEGLGNGLPMINEPMHDFSQADQRESFARAVAAVKVPPVNRVANAEDARQAIAKAAAAFPAWRDMDPIERSKIILKAAALLRDRRDEASAIMIREAGKPWREADADVCEAIDFCEYYARCAVRLFQPQRLGLFVGELNHQWYQPRGVTSVISPWNFPLAICMGMTTAALAVGNTAVVKPSTQTRAIAQMMCEILWQAGVPADVLHFLPGAGREIGDILVARSARCDDRLHRLERSGPAYPPCSWRHARGSAFRQESRLRDGRQERHHRR